MHCCVVWLAMEEKKKAKSKAAIALIFCGQELVRTRHGSIVGACQLGFRGTELFYTRSLTKRGTALF